MDYHGATITGLRKARERLAQLPREIGSALDAVDYSRRTGGPGKAAIRQACETAFRDAGLILAFHIRDKKGDRAASHRGDEYAAALAELRDEVQAAFAKHDDGRMGEAERLSEALTSSEASLVLDFREDIVEAPASARGDVHQHSTTNIHLRDNHGNIAALSGGSTLAGGQHQAPSDAQLVEALRGVEDAIRASALPAEEIERGLDQVALARAEIEGKQEPGRVRRFLKGSADFASRVGSGAAGGIIAAYLKFKFGI